MKFSAAKIGERGFVRRWFGGIAVVIVAVSVFSVFTHGFF